jgi:iron complex outermembrane receptor protein
MHGHTYGVTAEVAVTPVPFWRVTANYSNLQKHLEFRPGSTDRTGGLQEGTDPRNQLHVRSLLDLPFRTELDFFVRHVSALPLPGATPPVPAYTTFDVRLGWNPTADLELSAVGRSLADRLHAEFGPNGELVKREVYGILTWRF